MPISKTPQKPPLDQAPSFLSAIVTKVSKVFAPPPPNPAPVIAADVFEAYPNARPTESELNEFRRLHTAYRNAFRAANVEFTDAAAKRKWAALIEEHRHTIRKGELAAAPVRSYDSVASEFRGKQDAAKAEMRAICAEASAALAPARDRFVEAAEKCLEKLEADARADAQKLGMTYQPSARAIALRALIARLKNHRHANPTISPTALLPFIAVD